MVLQQPSCNLDKIKQRQGKMTKSMLAGKEGELATSVGQQPSCYLEFFKDLLEGGNE